LPLGLQGAAVGKMKNDPEYSDIHDK